METTRISPLGSAMQREAPGCHSGGRRFHVRRQRDLNRGLLSPMGRGNDYLVFQPSKYFARVLGDRLLRLNDALSQVRDQGPELVPSVGIARLQAHYAELDRRIEAARDRLAALIEYCHKGYTGLFEEAVEGFEAAASPPDQPGASGSLDTRVGTTAADVFEALRQRHFEQGILTEYGRDQGCVAFQPSPFFGRFLGEIAYSLNDALLRLEGSTSYHVLSGESETLQNYYLGLEGSLVAVGMNLDGIVAWCGRKVA